MLLKAIVIILSLALLIEMTGVGPKAAEAEWFAYLVIRNNCT